MIHKEFLCEVLSQKGILLEPLTGIVECWLSKTGLSLNAQKRVMINLRDKLYGKENQTNIIELPMSYEEANDMRSLLYCYVPTREMAKIELSFALLLHAALLKQYSTSTRIKKRE
jgi:hypothetical protein